MATTDFKTVDEYLASFPESLQQILRQVRLAIREAVPEAEEVVSYQIAAYKFHGFFLYFAGFKKHFSLFCPHSDLLFERFEAQISSYDVSKSKIRFSLDQPVPMDLIRSMAKYLAEENRSREELKHT